MRQNKSDSIKNIREGNSISFRLTTSIILTVLVISVLSNYVWYIKTKKKAEADLERNINRSISSIVGILEVPLWSYDEEAIEKIGILYTENELVVQLKIIDSLEKTLFEMKKENAEDALFRIRKVYHNNKIAGTVEMALTSINYKRVIRQMVWSGIVTTIINVSVLLLLTGFFLRLFLKKPISSLSTLVDSYASGNYDRIDTSNPYMEFQSVVNVITSMGDKITNQMEELRVAEKKFREIFENAVEGIFQFNFKGKFINANPSMARIMGYKNAEDLIENVHNLMLDCFYSLDAFKKISNSLKQNKIVTAHEVCVKKKNAKLIWVSLSLRSVNDKDEKLLFYEGSLVDISDKKEKEEAEKRQKTADAANQAKTLFIAKMSHEIRTPLNSVLGMTELLRETALSVNQKEYIDLLHSSGEFLQAIINDILDFSKIEAQQLEIDNIQFELSEIISDVSGLFAFKAAEKKIEFNCYLDPELSRFFMGDPVRLKQILINIIGNAVKFTDSGNVKVDVLKVNSPSLDDTHEEIIFKVSDTGIGIPESKQENIFESFTQAESFVTRQFGGTGLGLSICKKLIEHMDGKIEVESCEGKGTTFSFSIIFICAIPEISTITQEIQSEIILPALNILLVDDILPNRTVIHKFMGNFPVNISDAENGKEAVEKFYKNNYDLILMDVEMPLMDGLEATRIIRKWENENNNSPTPLIILSAHAFGEQRKKCYESGCDDLLVKPIRKKDLLKSISALILDKKVDTNLVEKTIKIDSDFEDLFPDFIEYFHKTLENMEKATLVDGMTELYRLGHGLKGSARNYELDDLGNIFLEIENAAKEKKMEIIIVNIKKAKNYLNTINVEFVNKG